MDANVAPVEFVTTQDGLQYVLGFAGDNRLKLACQEAVSGEYAHLFD